MVMIFNRNLNYGHLLFLRKLRPPSLARPVLLASRAHGFAVAVEILGNLLNVLRRPCCYLFAKALVTEVLKAVLAGEAVCDSSFCGERSVPLVQLTKC